MNEKLCSVIIPIYNGEKYLSESLDSALSQDYGSLEIILVDDASIDGSLELARHYQKMHPTVISVLTHRQNQGVVRTLLDGLQASEGEYISLFGQDDIMFPNRISTLVDAIQKYRVSMVCSNAYYLYGNEPSQDLVRLQFRKSRSIEKYLFAFENQIVGPSALFRKDDFSKIDTNLFQFRSSMEWIHWFQYTSMRGIYFISSPLLYYRRHPQNLSQSLVKSTEYIEYRRFCKENIFPGLSKMDFLLASGYWFYNQILYIFMRLKRQGWFKSN